ncbi:diguanylate cyclase [Acidobacteria bacterium AB60]|nr:diguanylate cyclase [Acidobacteria bacterium AB60]
MAERAELLEAALEVYREGLAILDESGRVIFWNRAAESITGFSGAQVLGRLIPGGLDALTSCPLGDADDRCRPAVPGALVHAQHQCGRDLPVVARRLVLRDGLGARVGSATVFHRAEERAAFPQAQSTEGDELTEAQADFQERLELAYAESRNTRSTLAVLWIAVDQAAMLRKTHGARACEAMLEDVERTLANALAAGEELGRWGEDEFLLVAREAAGTGLAQRAQALTSVARTTDFRWWGDRISLSVSVGGSIAEPEDNLPALLERSRQAMEASMRAGGNHATVVTGRIA